MSYDFDFSVVFNNFWPLLEGLETTILLALGANALGLTVGFIVCLMTLSPFLILRAPAKLFIEFFRCTPVLIQVVWFFYCVPILFNVYLDPMTMGVLALGLNLIAFNAEAYRAGVQAVPREHLDACVALGLGPWNRTVYVVLPQALRNAIPVLMTNGITILQQSALVAIVAVADLMYAGKILATDTYRPLEVYTVVAVIYFLMSLPISQLVTMIERRQDAAVER
ncbi:MULTISPECIES: amino acid ABC transporter permease [unclassified Modicisalibacter]|uniref:amino acid ABC transporter permease n=1 Tax=unclassified Modicisalibacter TaxID=2679913 RepID=UPI001CCBD9C4|nr:MULTISPECIES: amino acid ABC transporter permease [unclassified Modicisalibacter]MBZ9557946.1 amino acid ABC transporter permease [Modicisalibacter sp. R2A 31.J]MBZ9573386.1 amino acid ABC transporter permease [Modicisalibacter sp. MOD 31.J]